MVVEWSEPLSLSLHVFIYLHTCILFRSRDCSRGLGQCFQACINPICCGRECRPEEEFRNWASGQQYVVYTCYYPLFLSWLFSFLFVPSSSPRREAMGLLRLGNCKLCVCCCNCYCYCKSPSFLFFFFGFSVGFFPWAKVNTSNQLFLPSLHFRVLYSSLRC